MTTVQVIPHLGNLTSALLITDAGVSVSESLAFTSPFYRVMFSLMGRLVSQSPELYTSIVMENPETVTMLERRIAIEQRLVRMIRDKDHAAFEELFAQANNHFGSEVTKEANELFMRILGVLSTLYGKNSVTLEFSKAQSRPGLLEQISRVFRQRKINLTGINSVALGGNCSLRSVLNNHAPPTKFVGRLRKSKVGLSRRSKLWIEERKTHRPHGNMRAVFLYTAAKIKVRTCVSYIFV
jgi:hypothetical protein